MTQWLSLLKTAALLVLWLVLVVAAFTAYPHQLHLGVPLTGTDTKHPFALAAPVISLQQPVLAGSAAAVGADFWLEEDGRHAHVVIAGPAQLHVLRYRVDPSFSTDTRLTLADEDIFELGDQDGSAQLSTAVVHRFDARGAQQWAVVTGWSDGTVRIYDGPLATMRQASTGGPLQPTHALRSRDAKTRDSSVSRLLLYTDTGGAAIVVSLNVAAGLGFFAWGPTGTLWLGGAHLPHVPVHPERVSLLQVSARVVEVWDAGRTWQFALNATSRHVARSECENRLGGLGSDGENRPRDVHLERVLRDRAYSTLRHVLAERPLTPPSPNHSQLVLLGALAGGGQQAGSKQGSKQVQGCFVRPLTTRPPRPGPNPARGAQKGGREPTPPLRVAASSSGAATLCSLRGYVVAALPVGGAGSLALALALFNVTEHGPLTTGQPIQVEDGLLPSTLDSCTVDTTSPRADFLLVTSAATAEARILVSRLPFHHSAVRVSEMLGVGIVGVFLICLLVSFWDWAWSSKKQPDAGKGPPKGGKSASKQD